MIEIKMFQVFDGDCIWIRYGEDEKANIIVDLGYLDNFKSTVLPIFSSCISGNEKIDVLIITHNDYDHISGIKGFTKRKELLKFINIVWLNNPYTIINSNETDKVSYNDGEEAYKFFSDNNVIIQSNIHNGNEIYTCNGAQIVILSPLLDHILSYNTNWKEAVDKISAEKDDWGQDILSLSKQVNPADSSISNKVSISFIFEYAGKKILFLGDSKPQVVVEKLKQMGYSEHNPICLDYIKLSHHGSKYNITDDLIKIINCSNYLISSNGRNLYKQTLAKIISFNKEKKSEPIKFFFNHSKDVYDGLFKEEELREYSDFECYFAEIGKNYIEININC